MSNKALLTFGLCLTLIGCNLNNEKQANYSKRTIEGNGFIESYLINDSIIEGVASFYSEKGKLERKSLFKNGIQEGVSLEYYSNGLLRDSVYYYCNLKNGSHYVFDSLGKLIYQDYFFFGKRVGGKTHYKNGIVKKFSFSNFENTTLFSCTYDSVGLINRFGGEIVNAFPYSSRLNELPAIGVFLILFILRPLAFLIHWELPMKKAESKKKSFY